MGSCAYDHAGGNGFEGIASPLIGGSLQQQLVIDDIEPAIELLTDLFEVGDLAEAQLLMQVTATYVVCRDAGHQGMKASRPTIGNQLLHHAPTDAFARMRRG